ncbi:hypothetical protein [Dubosiella newyorkensis]|jgi:hypothetical protein|uniref:DUF4430 domain-containing protein n=2 Tax=Dubosiella newyorkensis TaxID=1862672 RepID=A0A1U7NQS3_9FIRM|nr:hypothetical protein [Dubosiella newyorkensis]MCI9042171.1 DUF4430 domain-containing protein [Dubosiella newyorkensis]OLU47978.1 hypothetical protein BO225_00680 [Dubosiella newyorkensis]
MKKKWLFALIALLLVVGILLISKLGNIPSDPSAKQIHIQVVDETAEPAKTILSQSYSTNSKTLKEFLETEKELEAKLESGSYGTILQSIKGMDQDMDKGPWLIYESNTNPTCKEQGACPVMDDIPLKDQDKFIFKRIQSF